MWRVDDFSILPVRLISTRYGTPPECREFWSGASFVRSSSVVSGAAPSSVSRERARYRRGGPGGRLGNNVSESHRMAAHLRAYRRRWENLDRHGTTPYATQQPRVDRMAASDER